MLDERLDFRAELVPASLELGLDPGRPFVGAHAVLDEDQVQQRGNLFDVRHRVGVGQADGRGAGPRHAGAEASVYMVQQLQRMRVFDALIWNWDRNLGNMLWASDWTLWMIDHTRAFRLDQELHRPSELLRIERSLLDAMRAWAWAALASG